MIETNPEVSVSELMERVRTKTEEIRHARRHSKLRPVSGVKEIATVIVPKPVTPKTEQILRAAQVAREATTVSRWIPKPLRGLFRRQDKFNREMLRAIEWLSNTNAQLVDRLRHLIACVEVQDHAIQHLTELRRDDRDWMSELARIRDNDVAWMEGVGTRLSSMANDRRKLLLATKTFAQKIAALEQKNLATETAVAAVDQKISAISEQIAMVARNTDQLSIQTNSIHAEHNALVEAVRGLRSEFNNAADHLRHLQIQTDGIRSVAADLERELANRALHDKQLSEQLGAETAQGAAVRHNLESLEQRQTSDFAFIKAELSLQSELVHKLIFDAPAGKRAKGKRAINDELSEAAEHRLDAFYFSFENRFRGPRDEIKRRLRFYLPIVEKCRAGKRGRPIVDLGCGRGEWLELLREQKLTVTGVDLNKTMVDQCKQRALDVVQSDALEFLRGLSDDSQGAITGFHIIEHLPLDTLVSFIAETFRVLQPGGIAIFESPNCKNLTVGACSFYIDPTHRNPVFPETAQFMLQSYGFERVTLEYLSPVETTDINYSDEHSAHLRALLFGPRDFSVIGYKPTDQQLKRLTRSQ
jgi:2-polyprenyl-3-methyl-5-hydroxy-6-metoxy-1,4-benzoquinol methylase